MPSKGNQNDKSFFKTVAGYFSNRKDFPQQEDEVKRKNQTHAINLKFDVSPSGFMASNIVNQLIDQESQMNYQDRLVTEAYEKKNELESFVYDFRRKLDEKYAAHLPLNLKTNLLSTLDRIESWLYGEGSRASKFDYQNKLDELKKEILSIETKYKYA